MKTTQPPSRSAGRGRRLATVAAAMLAGLALVACSSNAGTPDSSAQPTFSTGNAAYDAVINAGPVADAATVSANSWASAVKASGTLRVGGTQTSQLFSLMDPISNQIIGFDAGLWQLLSRYIFGSVNTKVTIVTSATREQVITSKQVDVVLATYSITPARMQQIDFAGPYYASQAAILVKADNTSITSVDDLADKNVATQAGSTGVALLQQYAPKAKVVTLPDDAQCQAAVTSGQVDAYVIDQTILLSDLITNTGVKLAGQPFGPADSYGIGVLKGSDGKAFINQFLTTIEQDGTWQKLWAATIQAKTKTTQTATPPAIGSAGN
ncbi:MAG: glutamate ABC transporter substrate-binding protein [Propionibacteriaceae bacterium]|nr:glutamate ABC transporter substrate-binding protein [Propionibacteriaceae bacterium]